MEDILWILWLPSSCHHGYSLTGSSSVRLVWCLEAGINNLQYVTMVNTTCFSSSNFYKKEHEVLEEKLIIQTIVFQWIVLINIQFPTNILVVTCPTLDLENGEISYDVSPMNGSYPTGATGSFSCSYGYSLSGTSTRSCDAMGNWNNQDQIPICNLSNEIIYVIGKGQNHFSVSCLSLLHCSGMCVCQL